MRKLTLQLLLLTLISIFLGCGGGNEQANSGGSGSEIVGVVQTTYEEGSSRYARADYSPIKKYAPIYMLKRTHKGTGLEIPETYTDPSDGSFKIAYAEPGQYLIEAVDTTTNKSLVRYVEVNGDGKQRDLGYINIEDAKTIKCIVDMPDYMKLLDIEYKIYVLGTRIFGNGDQNNLFVNLENIPLGVEHIIRLEMTQPISYSADTTVDISSIPSINFSIDTDDITLPF